MVVLRREAGTGSLDERKEMIHINPTGRDPEDSSA